MLASVVFENFMALRKVEVPLEPLTVLVGPNASGKTSVLRGLHLLSNMSYMPPYSRKDDALPSILDLVSRGSDASALAMEGVQGGEPMHLRFSAAPNENDENWKVAYAAAWEKDSAEWIKQIPASWSTPRAMTLGDLMEQPKRQLFERLRKAIRSTPVLHLDALIMAQPAYSDEEVPRIAADGEGLAAVLTEMAAAHPERLDSLMDALRTVVPAIRQVRLIRKKIERSEWESQARDSELYRKVERSYWGHEIVFDTHSATGIPARLASEGTLLVLGLLAVLVSPSSPRLVLMDDIDRGLHPRAQGDLIRKLRALMARDPELQIVATSHSPYLVEHLRPEEVRITVMEDGWTRCGRLVDHPDYPRWKDQMSPGEFWSSVGEDWLKGAGDRV